MGRRGGWLTAALLGAAVAGGCATTAAINDARQSLDQARGAGAETKAPYEYHAAEAFLGLAQHELDELDVKGAQEFAGQSVQFSNRALAKSQGGAQ